MTNWLKEFSDVLPERNKKQEVVLIKDTNLKSQDVILFEEGILPRKGVVNMQVCDCSFLILIHSYCFCFHDCYLDLFVEE